ncbi:MFS transporter [Pseudonocardia sp. HH130630-07]|nr:MFS transporter [Pseudonocardia sp. HH130630-07]
MPLVIWLLAASAFVMILNETIMSVALPVLVQDLSITVGTAQWLTSGFLLVMAVVIPMTGYLLDRFSPRHIFLAAMTLFVLGTLVCALAPGFAVLMLGRIIQASGTAVMLPLLMTTAVRLIPPQRRGATMGTVSLAIGVAPAIGPTVSGIILTSLSWRWMFGIVLPIALLALVAGARRLESTRRGPAAPLDLPSVVLSALAFGGLLFGISSIGESVNGEAPIAPWIPIVVGALSLVLFVLRQVRLQREDRALLDLRAFTHRRFTVSLVLIVLSMMGLIGSFVLLPLYLQNVLHASTFVTGLAILPGGLTMAVLGTVVGRLYDRFGARPLVIPGTALVAIAQWLFTTLGATSAVWVVVAIHLVLMMVGVAFILTPVMSDALGNLPSSLDSHGSAILSTLQQFGGAVGTALFTTVTVAASASVSTGVDAGGTQAAFVCAAVVATAAVGVALAVRRRSGAARPVSVGVH